MSLPPGTRVAAVDHRGKRLPTLGTVADWEFSNPAIGRFRSLIRWDDGRDCFVDDAVLVPAKSEQGVLL